MNIEDAPRVFPGAAGYLNTAAIGLPPDAAVAALHQAITSWQDGEAHAPDYDIHIDEARQLFATMMGVPPAWVAIGSQVSALVGLVATTLRPGSHVLFPEGEFTSVIFPFLVRDDLDLNIEFVPLESLADAIEPGVDLVAFSAVQSSDGRVADLTAIESATRNNGVRSLVDATQAAGWLPIDATRFDFVVAGAYKWLLSPRGTAFLVVEPELVDQIQPLYAGWYAGESPWDSIYDAPLRLATDARRFDLSPGWLAWVGTVPGLQLIDAIGIGEIHHHNVRLANCLREALELAPSDSAIVSLKLPLDYDDGRLEGLSTSYRAGRLRVGFHLYNTMDDVDRLVAALRD
jgi:selenocysteine lyase/cysteine desulfurase